MAELTFEGGINQSNDITARKSECIDGQNFELQFNQTELRRRKNFDLKVRYPGENLMPTTVAIQNWEPTTSGGSALITTGVTVDANGGAAPPSGFNETTTMRMTISAVNEAHNVVIPVTIQGFDSTNNYNFSIYLRPVVADDQHFFGVSIFPTTYLGAWRFDGNAADSASSNPFFNIMTDVGDGWFRADFDFSAPTSNNPFLMFGFDGASLPDGPHVAFLGNGTDFVDIFIPQWNEGTEPLKGVNIASLGGGAIRGIHQLEGRDAQQTQLVVAGTDVFQYHDSQFKNDAIVATVNPNGKFRDVTWQLDDVMLITDINKTNPVYQWDGATFSIMVTGLADEFRAAYAIVHNGRVWFANINAGAETPHLIAVTEFENYQNLSVDARGKAQGGNTFTTLTDPFFLTVPDLKEINGFDVFNQQIIISTKNGRLYKIIGDNPNNYNVVAFYQGSAAIGTQAFSNIGNDLTYVRNGGVIESLVATETSGDVQANDLSLFIPLLAREITDAIIIYEQETQKVYFFTNNQVLVLFKEIIPTGQSPWSLYRSTFENAMDVTAAKYYLAPGETKRSVLFGDSDGNVYDINGVLSGDGSTRENFSNGALVAGVAIETRRKISLLDQNFSEPYIGRVMYRRNQEVDLTIDVDFGDEANSAVSVVRLKASAVSKNYYDNDQYYQSDNSGDHYGEGNEIAQIPRTRGWSTVGLGNANFIELRVNDVDEFNIDKVIFDDDSIETEQKV